MRALHRKGKSTGVSHDDAKVVAAIHTVVTESTWAEIMEYEELHAEYGRLGRSRWKGQFFLICLRECCGPTACVASRP